MQRPLVTEIGTMPQPRAGSGPVSIGRYRIERVLGSGGCGVVYAARHDMLGKPVAIKILRTELVQDTAQSQRFLREARIAAALTHENIVNITDFGTDETSGAPFLVMELLRGRTLKSLLGLGPIPWPRAVNILLQLSRALACAHADGVLHRDLKPHNVMLESASGRNDLVKLCDFGLSRLRDGGDRITSTGAFLGTPAYMAPEQIRGDVQDERCDLYALGVTAYEMLTGTLPYKATSPVSLVAEILAETRAPLTLADDIPEALTRLITRCLARDPAARPVSASEIENELLAISSLPTSAPADLVGQTIGNYKVISALGSGGSGSVWLGEHPVIGTKFAIKVLRPEVAIMPGAFERFINEARAASAIPSSYIARYIDLGRLPGGQPYAVIEYLDGETLHARLDRKQRLDVGTAVGISQQVASALVQAHGLSIVHRDIKPANVFLVGTESSPTVKLLDFGIAKLGGPAASGAPKTQIGFFMGTVPYCPPEQLMGLEVGPAADVYALGATMFEMLVGNPPFTGDATDIAVQATSREAPTVRSTGVEVPAALDALIAAMLMREPRQRPTMGDVLARLESLGRREPSKAPSSSNRRVAATAPAVEPPTTSIDRSTLDGLRAPSTKWIARGAIVLVAAIGVWVLWPSGDKRTTSTSPPPAAAAAPEPTHAIAPAPTIVPAEPPPSKPPVVAPETDPGLPKVTAPATPTTNTDLAVSDSAKDTPKDAPKETPKDTSDTRRPKRGRSDAKTDSKSASKAETNAGMRVADPDFDGKKPTSGTGKSDTKRVDVKPGAGTGADTKRDDKKRGDVIIADPFATPKQP